MLLLSTGGASYAQVRGNQKTEFKGIERWAFKTNAFGWLVTVPNFTAEVDLTPHLYNRSTFSMTGKYNWNTKHKELPYYVFNYAQFRPEYRYYFRTENVESLKKRIKNPKNRRANYFGVYADAGTYTFKIGEYGRQGYMCGAGFSFGYGVPMYEYKTGAIDIELGFSLGVMLATTDVFVLNETDHRYDVVTEMCKPLHIIPSPVVSELSLTFAWRKVSIKEKYSKINQERRMAKLARQDSIIMARQAKEDAKLQAAEAKARKKLDARNAKELKKKEKTDKKTAKETEKLEKKAGKGKKGGQEAAVTEGKPKKEKPPKEDKKKKEEKSKKEKKPKEKDARKK